MSEPESETNIPASTPAGPVVDSGLPSPHNLPLADLVIFDGNCAFCLAQVKKLRDLDGKNRLAFISLHDEFVRDHMPDLSHEQMMAQMYVVPKSENGYSRQRFGGAAAVRYLTRRLPRLWILAPLFHIPFTQPVQQWCYRQIARRRYKLAGTTGMTCGNGTCDLHFQESSSKRQKGKKTPE